MATGLTDPAVGDYKIVSFFDEFRDDDWYQTSASIKGDLGFAELTLPHRGSIARSSTSGTTRFTRTGELATR